MKMQDKAQIYFTFVTLSLSRITFHANFGNASIRL